MVQDDQIDIVVLSVATITVTDLAGGRITFGRGTGRHFAKWISALLLGIGFLLAAFTEKKQALHDMMADTLVVRKTFSGFSPTITDRN